jgi:AcrR family transcriptional regulator
MPKLKPEETEQRRREIIDAARACFLRNGFHQTTTDEICREGSITPGGLYHYFGSKDEIIAAVINHSTHSTLENLTTTAESSGDARSAIQALATIYYQWLQDPELDNATRLDIEIWGETLRNDKLAAIAREAWVTRRRWLEWIIGRGKQEGYYRPEVDPAGFANLIMALFDGLRLGRLLWKDEFDVTAALQALLLMQTGQLVEPSQANGDQRPELPRAGSAKSA